MLRMAIEEGDDATFLWHARTVFNRRFHSMNTSIHSFALFLHPLCRKLAIYEAAKGRSLQFMVDTALSLTKQWRWNKDQAMRLAADVKQYYQCEVPFAGGGNNGLHWWQHLAVNVDTHPLKKLAIRILLIVPHAGEVE